ncbi:MAG: cysteine hydrolase family protein [Deltaproteobacteria bacterium]|nr:cysteine hydrolase family protein [Deltaproteobacteria bacterium]
MKTALILIDIQNDYFPKGKRELEGSVEASLQAKNILDFFRQKKWPIFHVQHISRSPQGTVFLPNTEGVHLHSNVQPLGSEPVIQKHHVNCFRETSLLDLLRQGQVTRLVILGMMTHMCVHAAARAAFDFGFECVILHDACATRALSFHGQTIPARQVHASFLAALSGVYGQVMGVEEFISMTGSRE